MYDIEKLYSKCSQREKCYEHSMSFENEPKLNYIQNSNISENDFRNHDLKEKWSFGNYCKNIDRKNQSYLAYATKNKNIPVKCSVRQITEVIVETCSRESFSQSPFSDSNIKCQIYPLLYNQLIHLFSTISIEQSIERCTNPLQISLNYLDLILDKLITEITNITKSSHENCCITNNPSSVLSCTSTNILFPRNNLRLPQIYVMENKIHKRYNNSCHTSSTLLQRKFKPSHKCSILKKNFENKQTRKKTPRIVCSITSSEKPSTNENCALNIRRTFTECKIICSAINKLKDHIFTPIKTVKHYGLISVNSIHRKLINYLECKSETNSSILDSVTSEISTQFQENLIQNVRERNTPSDLCFQIGKETMPEEPKKLLEKLKKDLLDKTENSTSLHIKNKSALHNNIEFKNNYYKEEKHLNVTISKAILQKAARTENKKFRNKSIGRFTILRKKESHCTKSNLTSSSNLLKNINISKQILDETGTLLKKKNNVENTTWKYGTSTKINPVNVLDRRELKLYNNSKYKDVQIEVNIRKKIGNQMTVYSALYFLYSTILAKIPKFLLACLSGTWKWFINSDHIFSYIFKTSEDFVQSLGSKNSSKPNKTNKSRFAVCIKFDVKDLQKFQKLLICVNGVKYKIRLNAPNIQRSKMKKQKAKLRLKSGLKKPVKTLYRKSVPLTYSDDKTFAIEN